MDKPNNLKLLAWNANGIKTRKPELETLVAEELPDVILLSETRLRPTESLPFANYCVYNRPRPNNNGAGGVSIMVRRSIPHCAALPNNHLTLEHVAVYILTDLCGTLKIISAYLPPNKPFPENEIREALEEEVPTVLAGDLNAKNPAWNCRRMNPYGRRLNNLALNSGWDIQGPVSPTYFNANNRPDVLDITIAKSFQHSLEVSTIEDTSSDHNPICVQLGQFEKAQQFYTRKKVHWQRFVECLALHQPPAVPTDRREVELSATNLTQAISNALSTATVATREEYNSPYTLPRRLQELHRRKRDAKKRAQRTLNPADRRTLNWLTRQLRDEIKEFRNEAWTSKLARIDTAGTEFWKLAKNLKKHNPRTKHPLHGERGLVFTDEEKSNAFADYLSRTFRPYEGLVDHENEDRLLRRAINNIVTTQHPHSIPRTTENEVTAIIKSLKTKVATGQDGISNAALKRLPAPAIRHFTDTINGILMTQYFPAAWKKAMIIMLPKNLQSGIHPADYRPISLISSAAKVAERIIKERIEEEISDKIPLEQFGFRQGLSTELQIVRVTEKITSNFDIKDKTGMVLLDLSKAFDKVWHVGLLTKMVNLDMSPQLVKLTASYLNSRYFTVKVGMETSAPQQIKAGVPQGSVLGPTLFNIYMADIPRPPGIELALYADDSALYTAHRRTEVIRKLLQNGLDLMEEWADRWRLRINPAKTQAIIFAKGSNIRMPLELTYEDQIIPWTNEVKYLGTWLDQRLTWRTHINKSVTKTNQAIGHLKALLYPSSQLTLKNRRLLWISMIRPILLYACPAWATAASTHVQKMEAMQNKALRLMSGAPWFLRNSQLRRELKIESMRQTIKKRAQDTLNRMNTLDNSAVRDVLDYNPINRRKYKGLKDLLDPG